MLSSNNQFSLRNKIELTREFLQHCTWITGETYTRDVIILSRYFYYTIILIKFLGKGICFLFTQSRMVEL